MAVHKKNIDVVHALIFAGANVDLAEYVRILVCTIALLILKKFLLE